MLATLAAILLAASRPSFAASGAEAPLAWTTPMPAGGPSSIFVETSYRAELRDAGCDLKPDSLSCEAVEKGAAAGEAPHFACKAVVLSCVQARKGDGAECPQGYGPRAVQLAPQGLSVCQASYHLGGPSYPSINQR